MVYTHDVNASCTLNSTIEIVTILGYSVAWCILTSGLVIAITETSCAFTHYYDQVFNVAYIMF